MTRNDGPSCLHPPRTTITVSWPCWVYLVLGILASVLCMPSQLSIHGALSLVQARSSRVWPLLICRLEFLTTICWFLGTMELHYQCFVFHFPWFPHFSRQGQCFCFFFFFFLHTMVFLSWALGRGQVSSAVNSGHWNRDRNPSIL